MFLLSLTCTILSLSFSIILARSPLILGSWILLIALSISLLIRTIIISWLGILVFLIYIGGILVIFAYFRAIQPNQQLQINNIFFIFLITFIPIIFILYRNNKSLLIELNSYISHSIISLYQWHNLILLFFLGILLFFALVAVVKVSKSTLGPLRPFNYV